MIHLLFKRKTTLIVLFLICSIPVFTFADTDENPNYKENVADHYFDLGNSYTKSFQYQQAIDVYKQAISINPDYAEAHLKLALTYHYLGMYKEAVDSYKQLIRINPDNVQAHRNLGFIYVLLEDHDSALDEYRILQDLHEEYASELFDLIYPNIYLCTRVIDGDTIVVIMEGKMITVRLIGVDTPETKYPKKPVEYYGKEASAFTKQMVEGRKVHLDYDQQRRDKYGRLLAYVYLGDGTFLNAEIVKQGYGFAYTRFPFKYIEQFREYEKDARENNRGLWSREI